MITKRSLLQTLQMRNQTGDFGGACFGTPCAERLRGPDYFSRPKIKEPVFREGEEAFVGVRGEQGIPYLHVKLRHMSLVDEYNAMVAYGFTGPEDMEKKWIEDKPLVYDLQTHEPLYVFKKLK